MISCCIFSKNRPMQLDACLRSMKKNAPYITDINVLYTFYDVIAKYKDGDLHTEWTGFHDGYEIVKKEHPDVKFIQEGEELALDGDRLGWKNRILSLVEGFNKYFMWGTDDSLFYRYQEISPAMLDFVFTKQRAKSLNLRIGKNIKWQNHWHSERVPEFEHLINGEWQDIVTWDSSNISVQNDVGRLWQNDASIMPRDEYLEKLLEEDHWYKGKGCRGLDNVAQSGGIFNPRIGACFTHSVYLNFPVNLVHVLDNGRLYADNWGKFIKQDIYSLNEKFLQGKRIDWESIDVSNVDCGRMEVEYTYVDA